MTPESTLPPELVDRARQIRLLALDVDGVLTDGRLYFQADGIEIKAFHTQDGHGIKLLRQAGIEVALITGRESPMVTQRAAALGLKHVFQHRDDKLIALRELTHSLGLGLSQAAYCGDDLQDLAAIQAAGLGISVPNAPSYMRQAADWVSARSGGHGAVRDICDTLLDTQGHWPAVLESYAAGASGYATVAPGRC
ncbi:3-deoxy-D-manno-octulosonate 8-phosphate phosphatase (KDO 8-P phosphatase) [Onishia taeanensis]|uniref:3-deoxy-D-manno-octulosonate 8-phosphate phosphatase KdsC n=1 Tax=Onishia taeanensis TaxID=284577 RepID=A0A1G7R8Q7_9GAMM|nr:HAD hydrolase family protein [Halomonas taeanensis]MAX32642.1 HAD family hydrolase [Halomonadaceae bacterium]SDG07186.1 3-deoxy-D-manno-octulosonate 8-phosphate phosphatase (KDO 8-P phosphatase) [Halomonas taeanensis]